MIRWLIWGGFALVWTVMLLLPRAEFQRAGLGEFAPNVKILLSKSFHVLAYGLFAFLSGWLCVPARYRWLPLYFIMAHAAVTELLQYSFPVLGRIGCLEDVCLNHIGILLGLIAGWKWWTDPK